MVCIVFYLSDLHNSPLGLDVIFPGKGAAQHDVKGGQADRLEDLNQWVLLHRGGKLALDTDKKNLLFRRRMNKPANGSQSTTFSKQLAKWMCVVIGVVGGGGREGGSASL